jgi:hypothetical protein
MGRILLLLGAGLLAVTAVIHGCGQPMVDGWIQGLPEQQKLAICLVWVSDSLGWLVVAILWTVASWRRGWLGAAAIGTAIPALTAAGILAIDPTFFGGWMLVGSVALAAAGLLASSRRHPAEVRA